MKVLKSLPIALSLLVLTTTSVFAHVVVKPAQVGVGSFQTFTMGIPNEKDNPTIAVRLIIPDGLQFVSPNVKPGWTIEVKKERKSEEAKVTEISWTGGLIPVGQRDDFYFSAKVPASETKLPWKVYQTYANGTVVSWDQASDPNISDAQREEMERKNLGPYSTTKIINDLNTPNQNAASSGIGSNPKLPLYLSALSIAISLVAIFIASSKKKR